MYYTVSIAGVTGPTITIFIMKGKNKRANNTDKFLRDNGAAPGSTVLMMPTVFMTNESWISATTPVVRGISISYPIVAENPQ